MITCLTGGVGGAKLALGLSKILQPDDLNFIVNTGDDFRHIGLRISPDVDTLIYTLAGRVNTDTGWGLAGDTFRCLEGLWQRGLETWFRLGDLDLATHLWRSEMLRRGRRFTEVVRLLARSFGVGNSILPPTDAYAPTYVTAGGRRLHLQEYFVRESCEPQVEAVEHAAAERSVPSRLALTALQEAELIVIGPSNPLISIDPILAVPGIRETICSRQCPAVAVCPIVAGKALKGPAAKMLAELGIGASADAVARHYRGLIDVFVIDERDGSLAAAIEQTGVRVVVTSTVMNSLEDKIVLAKTVIAQTNTD